MNCQYHPEIPATAYCRSCGKPLCDECRRDAFGKVFCGEHAPAAAPPQPDVAAGAPPPPPPPYGYAAPAGADVSPGLAFFLGTIPGVGAIYNGQYAKGLVHALIWGVLMSISNSQSVRPFGPIFGVMIAAWWFYMAFEAFHTARKRRMGEPVDEYSSLVDIHGKSHIPVAGVALILLGVVLLLHTLDVLDFERVARFWPVALIAVGAYLLIGRLFQDEDSRREARHERH